MIDILRRSWAMISDGARPIDWLVVIVDFLVLVAIVAFEAPEKWHKRKVRKRLASLSPFTERGQELLATVPEPLQDDPAMARKIKEWMNSLDVWGKETRKFLEQYSPRAAASFALPSGIAQAANPQFVYTGSGHSFPIQGPQKESYQRLVEQLNNLRSITEQPEAYF